VQSLDEIYLGAREIADASARAAYLAEACGADRELRRRVEAMLQDAAGAEDYFCVRDGSPPELRTGIEQPGTVIGRYKLLEKIGEGGMGVVYLAEQEKPVRRKVALKIIKLGMDTRQVVARFEAERQALALMDHPHIAQVLDGGATETGRPYFVMELVPGVPITEFCETNPLSIAERLELFMPVCQAIQSAHQKGIIHRDIKPSNVLVTLHNGAPHPMVIDFGVAKATNQKLTEKTLFTNFATMIGTPAYMSPEQAEMSKLDVDTRADIYSLGVLLYELLTGSPPFSEERLRSVAYGEMQRIIAEEEPERPSTRLRKKTLGKSEIRNPKSEIDADLDWIVMKCLEKDRNRRYETANGLAADIQRHLNDEPVLARPPSRLYEFQKTVHRHKVGFAATAAVIATLAAGVAVSVWQARKSALEAAKATRAERKAQAEAERANQESELARAAKDFLIQQVLGVNPYMEGVPDPNRRALVERVDRAIGTQFTNQPRVEAELRYALGDAYAGIGDPIGMIKQLERVLEIRRREFGLTNSDTLWALASTAEEYYKIGRKDESEKLLREGLAIVLASPHPLSSGAAEVLTAYSERRYFEGDPAEAYSLLQEAIAVARQTADPKSWRFQNKLMWLARYTGAAGRNHEAEAMFAEQIQFREREFGSNHPMTANLLMIHAEFLRGLGRTNETIAALERVLSIYRRSLDPNDYTISSVETSLAKLYEGKGHLKDAAGLYRSAYSRFTNNLSLFGHHHNDSAWRIADFFVRNRLNEDAKAVVSALGNFYNANPPGNSSALENFIRATAATQGWPAAALLCQKQFDSFPDSLWIWQNKAWVFRFVGDEEHYHEIVEKVLSLPPTAVGTNDQHAPLEIAALGSFSFSPEQTTQLDAMMTALQTALPERGTNQQIYGYRAIGQLQLRLGRLDQCLAALEKSALVQQHPDAYCLFIKAMCLHRLGRAAEACAVFEQAATIMKPQLGEPVSETEGFLPVWQIYQHLLMHRETRALLGLNE